MAYADPTSRLAVCVSTCPSPPSLADGAEPAYQLCTYGTVATAAATLADPHPHPHPHPNATSGCYPSYASVAVQGYCVPSSVAAQSSYDEAGVGLDAAALSSLQSDLLSASGRYFDATFGDVLLMWPLLLGIPLVVALLALGWSLGATCIPQLLYVGACHVAVVAFCGLTYVFWSEGEARQDELAGSGLGDDNIQGRDIAFRDQVRIRLVPLRARR